MKVLTFRTLHFKLPDDFDGDLAAALRALADYHDTVKATPKQSIGGAVERDKPQTKYDTKLWDDFWTMICESDRRVSGVACMDEYTDDEQHFDLDLNTGERRAD